MQNHIDFSAIDCENLQYIKNGKCYVCTAFFFEVDDTDICVKCLHDAKIKEEGRVRKYRRK
jgi:hypothetical protein